MQGSKVRRVLILLVCFVLVFSFLFSSFVVNVVPSSSSSSVSLTFNDVAGQINMTRIGEDIQTFTNFNRAMGYPGYDQAAQFIFDRFNESGLENVTYEYFDAVITYDYGASITVNSTGEVITAYTLSPNHIETCATPPEGVTGRLIYVDDSDISDYDGKNVNGSIVLIDYDCMTKWHYAVLFGAKAAIFIEKETPASDAGSKSLAIPLDFPRLYVRKADGEHLKSLISSSGNNEIEVNIKSFMVWRNIRAKNIVGFVEGKTRSDEYVVIAAHYDSGSVVSALAPGAEEACSIATLLELVRFFTKPENQPERSIMFLALSGGLTGAREFVYQHMNEVGRKLRLFVSLGLNSKGKGAGVLYWGTYYGYSKPLSRYLGIKDALKRYISSISQAGESPPLVDLIIQSGSEVNKYVGSDGGFSTSSEPFSLAGGLGIGFLTTYSSFNIVMGTPFDTYEKVNLEKLEPQVLPISYVIYSFLNDAGLSLPTLQPTIATSTGGWVNLKGAVWRYNRQTAWYDPVPNALVIVIQQLPFSWGAYFAVVMADDNGTYEVHGLQHRNSMVGEVVIYYSVAAFLDEPTVGPIKYAPDSGKYSWPSSGFSVVESEKSVRTTVFRCGSLAMIGASDPTRPSFLLQMPSIGVGLFESDVTPDFFGTSTFFSDRILTAMVFSEHGKRIEVILKTGLEVDPYAVLVNASSENLNGYGYLIDENTTVIVDSFDMLLDLYWINEERLSRAAVLVSSAIHNETRLRIQNAYDFLENHNYSAFYVETLEAWSRERSAYLEIKYSIKDIINTGVLYFALLLPFLFLADSFFFKKAGIIKRLVRIGSIFMIFLVIFYFLHPGLKMASNLSMVISGFFLTVLLMPGLFILITNIISILKKVRVSLLGAHFAETSRGSQLLMTFSVGIENLKRRRLRSTLNLLTIILLVFALVALTSISAIRVTKPFEFAGTTVYNGILVRAARAADPLQSLITTRVIDYFETKYSNVSIITSRVYLYPPGDSNQFTIFGPDGKNATIRAAIGLSVSEPEVSGLDRSISEGNGVWFTVDDEKSCLIPEELASQLNVGVGDDIDFQGLKLTVKGIYNSTLYSSIVDLDQDIISPVIGGQRTALFRVTPSSLIVLPYTLVKRLGSVSFSIAIKFSNETGILEEAHRLADTFPGLFMRIGIDGRIISFYSGEVSSFGGWQMLLVPLVIAAFTMTNVLLGSIYERTREISTFASIGLSPLHVSLMFLGESSIYAIIGSVLGYVLGLFVNGIIRGLNLLPVEVAPNIASSWLITSIGLSIVATFLATLYPMFKASKLVTPSLERRWKSTTKPRGDEWEVPLPFEFQNRETKGVLVFMDEFFQAHKTEESGDFWVRDLKITERKEADTSIKSVEMIARLAPYEASIEEEAKILFTQKVDEDRNTVALYIRRIYGILGIWKLSNRAFIDTIRKQLLLWRSLPPNERERYIETGMKTL